MRCRTVMQSVSFSIRRVNRLRWAAEQARRVPAEDPDLSPEERLSDGWSASPYDPHTLLRVFETLWLKAGFALHAYVFREGSNGNGIIWAVPADAPLVAPDQCPRLEDTWLHPPRPPGAVPLMHAIEGDGSPWSYLSASILSREAEEFGALWHGCVWSDQTILSKPPRQADGQETSDDARTLTSNAPVGHWTWHGAAHVDADVYRSGNDRRGRPAHPSSHRPRADLPGHGHLSCWQLRGHD